jgi:hypothetical protein
MQVRLNINKFIFLIVLEGLKLIAIFSYYLQIPARSVQTIASFEQAFV